jgi:hypothetical protein
VATEGGGKFDARVVGRACARRRTTGLTPAGFLESFRKRASRAFAENWVLARCTAGGLCARCRAENAGFAGLQDFAKSDQKVRKSPKFGANFSISKTRQICRKACAFWQKRSGPPGAGSRSPKRTLYCPPRNSGESVWGWAPRVRNTAGKQDAA